MPRNVTAIYRTRETADLVCRELEDIGIPRRDIHVIPDTTSAARTSATTTGTTSASMSAATTGTMTGRDGGAYRETTADMDRLHDLQLPEEDVRTYQQCVRGGDYVVSAEVDDESNETIERAKAVMRRPESEAHHIRQREDEFSNAEMIAHSRGDEHLRPEHRARPVAGTDDPYLRTYERDGRPAYRDRL